MVSLVRNHDDHDLRSGSHDPSVAHKVAVEMIEKAGGRCLAKDPPPFVCRYSLRPLTSRFSNQNSNAPQKVQAKSSNLVNSAQSDGSVQRCTYKHTRKNKRNTQPWLASSNPDLTVWRTGGRVGAVSACGLALRMDGWARVSPQTPSIPAVGGIAQRGERKSEKRKSKK